MKTIRMANLATLCAALMLAGSAGAETKVELKGTHLCCPACVTAAANILKKIDGVKGACDRQKKTITITATNDDAAKKALEALAAGGFYGEVDNKDLALKDDSGAPKGKVESLTLTGIHNCCGACNTAIKKAVKAVDGVKSDTAKARSDTFTVTGDFDAAALIKSLNDAGFHVKVKE